jgi:hypothetical protein
MRSGGPEPSTVSSPGPQSTRSGLAGDDRVVAGERPDQVVAAEAGVGAADAADVDPPAEALPRPAATASDVPSGDQRGGEDGWTSSSSLTPSR